METLRDELNDALLDLVRRVERSANEQREKRYASFGVSAFDGEALARLAAFPEGLSSYDWGELCELDPKATQALTRRAVQAGWVQRARSGRQSLLSLTEEGQRLVDKTRTATRGMFSKPLQELRLDELRTLVASLNRVLNTMNRET
ncbi:MAG: hypothetical protein AAF658_03705 [Myxococcota bacterium]